jgi:Fic family protein
MPDDKLLCQPDEKANREIDNQAKVLGLLEYFVKIGRTHITEGDVLQIHALTIEGIYPCSGSYRSATTQIRITGTNHKPSPAHRVRSDVRDMLDHLYTPAAPAGPIERAAYVMWRICAIHPFNGGNGRVARAVAFLVILTEASAILAGSSLPTRLKVRKSEYLAGLGAADNGDLTRLAELVLRCCQEHVSELSHRSV